MTKDDVTRLAHEAAGFDGTTSLERPLILYAAMSKDFLDKFANLVVQMEREACAKLVEADGLARGDEGLVLIKAAGRIRARGEK